MILCLVLLCWAFPLQAETTIKSLAHLSGLQENVLTGYGLVIGLAGSGDSRRNQETGQAIANVLQSFGVRIQPQEIHSRNSATVMIVANLPYYAHQGDKLDVTVASLGDATSLLGGTLLATPLKGPDKQIYALAQGSISVGGFKYDASGNVVQKNHPTTGLIPGGAIVEKNLQSTLYSPGGKMHLVLHQPDFTTAYRIENAINRHFGKNIAVALSAQDVEIVLGTVEKRHFVKFFSEIEHIAIPMDSTLCVVVNERTGTIVAGANVGLQPITISHGNLQIAIANQESWQTYLGLFGWEEAFSKDSHLVVKEASPRVVTLSFGSTIGDLLLALAGLHISTQDMIAILQTVKRAGALQAELIIQ